MATDVEMMAEGAVATLRFVSDGKANCLSSATLEALERQMAALSAEPDIRVWILTGSGATFAAGPDVKELADLADAAAAERISRLGSAVFSRLADAAAVTIAALNGPALGGGCELALACDLRVMCSEARIGLPQVTMGLIPGWGGTQRLARLVGAGWAKQMILTGQALTAEQARAIGLVQQVAPPGSVMSAAVAIAEQIKLAGPVAARAAKKAIDRGATMDLVGGLELETKLFADCLTGPESREGLKACLEKRAPDWRRQPPRT